METDPRTIEKLLLKKKPSEIPFPSIDQIPNRESYRYLVNPPVKSMEVQWMPKNVGEINDSCMLKLLTGGVMGSVMGAAFGLFMGSLSQMTSPMSSSAGSLTETGKGSVGRELKRSMRHTFLKSKSTARSMTIFAGMFSAMQCVSERVLGTKSLWTNAIAGCGAGLTFGLKKGPMSACMSCIGFAAFGIVVDMIMP